MLLDYAKVLEYQLCEANVVEFARRTKIIQVQRGLVPFEPFPFQEDVLTTFARDNKIILNTARQMGTTVMCAVHALHQATFRDFCNIVFFGTSLAVGMETLERMMVAHEALPDHLRVPIRRRSKTSVEFENGSQVFVAAMGSSSTRGLTINVAIVESVAWIGERKTDEFLSGVYPCIMSGPRPGQIILASSPGRPSGKFYDIVRDASSPTPIMGFTLLTLPWYLHPERDGDWMQAMRSGLGEASWRREFECEFVGERLT